MSKKRGLSLEEKREKMLELLNERLEVFQLKELEKIAPKAKGITFQSVKEVVQSLVDDNLVDSEKIGSSIYFWSFPCKTSNAKKQRLLELQLKVTEAKERLRTLDEELANSRVDDKDADKRERDLLELKDLQQKRDDLKEQVDRYKDCDPIVLTEMKGKLTVATEATNRWTDNVFAIKSWCRDQFNTEEDALNKQFAIPEDLDYI